MRDKIEELRQLISERSIRRAPEGQQFTLASGAKSSYYCDTKATTLSPHGAQLVGEVVHSLLDPVGVEAIGGLAMGSVFISTAVALISEQRRKPIYSFFVRAQAKEHGLKLSVEQSYHPDNGPLLSKGRRVAVVDDVVTAGGSIEKAIRTVLEQGCEIAAVIAVVDRCAGGGDRLLAQGLPYQPLFYADSLGTLRINDHCAEFGRLAAAGADR